MQSEAGSLLIEGGLVTEPQLQQALSASVRTGGSLVQNLVRLGLVADSQLAAFFATRLQIPLAEAAQFDNLPAFITRLVPTDVVMTHRTIPLMLHQGVLHVAISNPTNRAAQEEISFITGYSVSPVAAADALVEAAMARYYGIPPDDALPELSLPDSESDSNTGRYSIISRTWRPSGAGDTSPPSGTFDQAPPAPPQDEPAPPPDEDETPEAEDIPTITPVTPPASKQKAQIVEQPPAAQPASTPPPSTPPPSTPPPSTEPQSPNQGDPAKVIVEPATGELAELFGLGQQGPQVIELTQPKGAKAATSITDAIRLQVARETGDGQDGDSAGPTEEAPQVEEQAEVPSLWAASEEAAPTGQPEDTAEPSPTEAGPGFAPQAEEVPTKAPVTEPRSTPERATFTQAAAPEASVQPAPDGEEQPEPILEPLRDADEARYLIAQATDRDEVARTLVRYAHAFIPRVALFIVKKDILVGWLGAGKGINLRQIKGIMIPLSSPSVFRTVRETGTDYFGTLPRTTVNDIFLAALGDLRPRQALLIPVTVRHKPIGILYGDCGSEQGFAHDLSGIHLISQDASVSFEQLILQRKMNRLVKR